MAAPDDRRRRNEQLFRQVNERLREIGESFSTVAEHADFVCECADVGCAQRIDVTLAEYEGVRARPRHFLLLPGHEDPDLEMVVERHPGWIVTRKPPG